MYQKPFRSNKLFDNIMFRGWVKKYYDLALRDSEKGAVGCDEASLRIVNDVCQEWKEIVEEYCMTRGVIKA